MARVAFEHPFDEAMLVAAVLPARLSAGIVRCERILIRGGRDRQKGPPFTATTGGGPRGLDPPYQIPGLKKASALMARIAPRDFAEAVCYQTV